MKVYEGTRGKIGCQVTVREEGAIRPLDPRLDLHNHSPTGLEWGYGGSGPAQLALALLADALGDDEEAHRLHQDFKFKVVGRLPHDHWQLSEVEVKARVAEIERGRRARS